MKKGFILFVFMVLIGSSGQCQINNPNGPNGGGSGIGPGLNNFSPTLIPGTSTPNPNWHGDTKEIVDASWAGGGATLVTCPNNDCAFVPGDTGKLCWAIPGAMTVGPTAPGAFSYISANSGNCSATAIIGSAASNGVFEWGHDDTPAWTAAVAALYTQPKCGNLVIPAARSMLSQGLAYLVNGASDCSVNITGYGYDSVLVMEPGFNFAANTSNVGCLGSGNMGCFFEANTAGGAVATAYLYFTISGTNQIIPGGCPSGIPSNMFTLGPGAYAIGVNFFNWSANGCAPKGAMTTNVGPFGLGFAITNWFDGNIWCSGAACLAENDGGTNVTLKTSNGNMFDLFGTYSGMYTTGTSSLLHGFGSASQANNGLFGSSSCDHNAGETVFLEQSTIGWGTPGTNGIGFQFNSTGSGAQCNLYSLWTIFNGGATGSAIRSQAGGVGNWIDYGGNTLNGPLNFSGNYSNMTALNVFGACTGVATASSTLGLYGTGPNVTATTCTSATIGTGIVMNKNATVFELLATSTAAGVNASSGAVAVLKNGVAQTMTCTIGIGTACQDGATAHQFTVVPGDLLSLRFTSQAADTLAGVKATLVIE